jgi:CheY-like chemotaxis protein
MSAIDSSTIATEELQSVAPEVNPRLQIWDSLESLCAYHTRNLPASPLRVLLAEDNLVDQISIRRLLEKAGVDVTLVGDGRQAVDRFESGVYDFILLDILMPGMDGFEAALRIREQERVCGSHIPIVALTSYSLKAVYDKCKSVGMSGYLSKPVSAADLQRLFKAILPESVQ